MSEGVSLEPWLVPEEKEESECSPCLPRESGAGKPPSPKVGDFYFLFFLDFLIVDSVCITTYS